MLCDAVLSGLHEAYQNTLAKIIKVWYRRANAYETSKDVGYTRRGDAQYRHWLS
jgi:hypothetical protein